MTRWHEDADNYPNSSVYVEEFVEWLWNRAPAAIVRTAQQATASFAPPHVTNGSTPLWLEWAGNLDDKPRAELDEHLCEVLDDAYQSRPEYSDEAREWAHTNAVDAAMDHFRSRVDW